MTKDGFPTNTGEHVSRSGEALPDVDPDLLIIEDMEAPQPDEYSKLARQNKKRIRLNDPEVQIDAVRDDEEPEIDDESVYFVSKITLKGYLEDLEHSTGEQIAPSALGSVWRVLAVFAKSVEGVHFEPPEAQTPKDIEKIDIYTLSKALGSGLLSLSDRPENKHELLARRYIEDETPHEITE